MRRAGWAALLSTIVVGGSACDLLTDPAGITSGLEYGADALEVVARDHDWADHPITYLRASPFVVNVTGDSVTASSNDCMLGLEAFPASEAGGASGAAWSEVGRLAWPGGVGFVCLLIRRHMTVGPGDTLRFHATEIPLAEILADSLPSGRYAFRAAPRLSVSIGSSMRRDAPLIDLGEILLPESRHPLFLGPSPRDGFFYRVSVTGVTEAEMAARVQLEVSHGGHYDGSLTRELSANCPVRLLAFGSEEARETIPVPEPDWAWPRGGSCAAADQEIRLGPGEKQTFERIVPRSVLAPGSASVDDFFFMAIIDVDGRPIRLAVNPE